VTDDRERAQGRALSALRLLVVVASLLNLCLLLSAALLMRQPILLLSLRLGVQLERYERAADLAEADPPAALDVFRDLYAEGYPRAAHGLGCLLLDMGNPEGALACLSEYAPSPDLGIAFYALDRYDEAKLAFGLAFAEHPEDPLNLYHLAIVTHAAGRDARLLFEEVLAMVEPGDELEPLALRGLAECLIGFPGSEEAQGVLAQAEALEEVAEHGASDEAPRR
jgi:tetratricopeptide (TPR) repeat protein